MFGGYSWLHKRFALWTIYYVPREKRFHARPSESFHPLLSQVAFAGDRAKEARAAVATKLNKCEDHARPEHFEYLPFVVHETCSEPLIQGARSVDRRSSFRIAEHMNTRVMAVRWPGAKSKSITLLGRPLFEYENVDNWILDPDTFEVSRPRSFGHRSDNDTCRKERRAVSTGDG